MWQALHCKSPVISVIREGEGCKVAREATQFTWVPLDPRGGTPGRSGERLGDRADSLGNPVSFLQGFLCPLNLTDSPCSFISLIQGLSSACQSIRWHNSGPTLRLLAKHLIGQCHWLHVNDCLYPLRKWLLTSHGMELGTWVPWAGSGLCSKRDWDCGRNSRCPVFLPAPGNLVSTSGPWRGLKPIAMAEL